MKKVAFMFVAAMAMSFAACTGNKPAEQTEATEDVIEEAAEVVEEVVDTNAVVANPDSVPAEAAAPEAAAEVQPQ